MKIKTITCHNVYNFGASLQAYALMTYLRKLGHDTEIIDYIPSYLKFNIWAIGSKWKKNIFIRIIYFLYVVPKRISQSKRRKKFDRFTQERFFLTKDRYKSNDEIKENIPEADIYFAGSDQIWNTATENGKDPAFFLDFAPSTSILSSYAASFSVSEIEQDLHEIIKNRLLRFNYISVREKSGLKIINEFGISNAQLVLDPTFLLDKSEWLKITSPKLVYEKYIFIYDQENNIKIKTTALALAKKYNYKIVAIKALYPMKYADICISDAGPEEFLSLIYNAEICLTNSFHCIVFSLIFNREFLLFKRSHAKVNSRMMDLLELLKLNNRIFDDNNFEIDKINPINFSQINDLVIEQCKLSKTYIDKVLNSKIQ